MEDNKNALDELNKGTTMGMDALKYIIEEVKDKSFKKILKEQYKNYSKISKKINKIYDNYGKKEPHETSNIEKALTWSNVKIKTINDKSNSKIAEMLIQGTTMGIIEGRKLLNHQSNDINNNIKNILVDFVTMQEESVENLKNFL